MAVPTQHFPGQLIPLVMCHTYSVNFPQIQMEMLTTLQIMYRGGKRGECWEETSQKVLCLAESFQQLKDVLGN